MTDTEKILQAVENQRWYFFENNDKILFDATNALIWADLRQFPYTKQDGALYSYGISYAEVKRLLAQKNSERWGGFNDWRIPNPNELWHLVEKKNFPFKRGSYWRIDGYPCWCVENRGVFNCKDLDNGGGLAYISPIRDVCVLPCSSELVPKNFSARPQEILDIFTQNNLVPKFITPEFTELYRKIFINKPTVKPQSSTPTAKPTPLPVTIFDYRPLLAKFDTEAIAKSPIKYFDAVLSLTDELLDTLQQFEDSQKETIAENLSITLKLNAQFIANPNLKPEENSLLAERQRFLARRLELNTDEPARKILSVKAQAERFFTRLDEINSDNNVIRELAALAAEPRADFELLVENLSRIITDAQHKVNFFTANKKLVASVAKAHSAWSDAYKAFKTSLREELSAACRNESIDDEIFAAWYDDWQVKRFAIEQRFLPLAEFALKGNLSDAFEHVLNVLRVYRESVDKFYLHERKTIYQKFAFQAGGDLQEKFETESRLYNLAEKFQRDLQEIIFARDKTEERIFLLRLAEPLLNLPIDELSDFIRDRELDSIAEEILTRFAELRRQNFENYLADAQTFGEATHKRETEYNALIFRMRKDLNK